MKKMLIDKDGGLAKHEQEHSSRLAQKDALIKKLEDDLSESV